MIHAQNRICNVKINTPYITISTECVVIMFVATVSIAFIFPIAVFSDNLNSPRDNMIRSYTMHYTYSYWKLKLIDAATYESYVDKGIDAYGPDRDFEFQLMLAPYNISNCGDIEWNDFKDPNDYQLSYDVHGLLVEISKPSQSCTIDEIIYNIGQLQIPKLNYILFSQGYKAQFDTLLYNSQLVTPSEKPSDNTYAPSEYRSTSHTEHSQPPSDVPADFMDDGNTKIYWPALPTIVFLPINEIQSIISRMKKRARNEGTSPYYLSGELNYWNFRVILSSSDYSGMDPSKQNALSNNRVASFVTVSIVGALFLVIVVGTLYVQAKTRWDALRTQRPSSAQNPATNDPSNNHETKATLTFEEFEALPRIHYNRSQTYSMRKNFQLAYDIRDENDVSIAKPVDAVTENRIDESYEQGTQCLPANIRTDSIDLSDNNIHKNEICLNSTGINHGNVSSLGNEICSICVEEFHNAEMAIMLPECKHLYHIQCLGLWLLDRKSEFCPVCKVKVINREKTPNLNDIHNASHVLVTEAEHIPTSNETNDHPMTLSTIPSRQCNNNEANGSSMHSNY